MGEPQPKPQKSMWDVVGIRIGVVSGAVGLLIAVIGLPRTVADALGRSESEVTELEVQQKRTELAEAGARLDVRYQILTADLFSRTGSGDEPEPGSASTLESLPTASNEILAMQASPPARGCGFHKYPRFSIGLLVITNRGRRDATGVAVQLDRLRLAAPVRIREGAAGGEDYVAKLRGAATTITTAQLRLPRTLGPGEGVRIPLFIADVPWGQFDRWCAIPSVVYLPRSLSFVDPALRSTTETRVRRMVDPVLLENGAIDRG